MTFLSPWRLLLLLVPVVVLLGYLAAQRARQRAAVRFSSVDLLASVVPARSGWQRHVPAAALLAALAVLVLGFAQPAAATRTPRQRATIMLALDTSASMTADDVAPSRLAAAQRQAESFVQHLPPGLQVGLVSFAATAQVLAPPTSDRSTVLAAINALQVGTATATADGIQLSLDALAAVPPTASGKKAPAVVVLMSDGTPTVGRDGLSPADAAHAAAVRAKQQGVPIDTIAFGTSSGTVQVQGQVVPVPFDPAAMASIATASSGKTFTAQTSGQLKSVYDQIGRAVGYEVHHHEVTAWFTGAGLALAVTAAAGALVWTQRML